MRKKNVSPAVKDLNMYSNQVFRVTQEDVITYSLNPSALGLWAWAPGDEILSLSSTRELAEAKAADNSPRSTEVTLSLRQDQLVDLLHIIRAHKASLDASVHIPEIGTWYERVEAIQDRVTSTIINK